MLIIKYGYLHSSFLVESLARRVKSQFGVPCIAQPADIAHFGMSFNAPQCQPGLNIFKVIAIEQFLKDNLAVSDDEEEFF